MTAPTKPDQSQAPRIAGVNNPQALRAAAAWKALSSPRLGMRGYLCVLAYLSASPATTFDIAADFGLSAQQHAREMVNRMGELGMAHTVGTVRTGRAGPLSPLWRAGPGPVERSGPPCRARFPELMQLRRILAALEDPRRVREVSYEVGSGQALLLELVAIGRKLGMMHIAAWDMPAGPHGGGVPVACWALGAGPDMPRPKRIGNRAVKRAWYARTAAKARSVALQNAIFGGTA